MAAVGGGMRVTCRILSIRQLWGMWRPQKASSNVSWGLLVARERVCEVCGEYCLRVGESWSPYFGHTPKGWRHVLPGLDEHHTAKPLPLPTSPWREASWRW